MRNSRRGFTLFEIVISLGILGFAVVTIGTFAVGVLQYNRNLTNQLDVNRQTQRMIVQIERELRTASPSSLGAYPIESATATSLVYFANIDSDNYKERIRYFMSGTTLKRGVTKPSGAPLTYNPANEKIYSLVDNVTNGDIFSYYDQNYTGTSAALAFPVTVTDIRLVKVRLLVSRQPAGGGAPFEAVTSVEVRNLKVN